MKGGGGVKKAFSRIEPNPVYKIPISLICQILLHEATFPPRKSGLDGTINSVDYFKYLAHSLALPLKV